MSKKLLVAGVMLALVATVVGGAVVVNAQSVTCANIGSMLTVLGITDATKVAQANAALGCGVAAPAAYTFTRNLTIGSTGADVTALQTKLGVTPATGYFGAITKAAVMAYQTANGIVPATGYVGPLTLAKLNYVAVTTTTTTTGTSVVSGGNEGDIKALTVLASPSNETISEGESVKVFGFQVEATTDSDLSVQRVDVNVDESASLYPWKSISSANLLLGSKVVATISDLDVKDSWTEVDAANRIYRLRFTGVDTIVKAGTKAKFYVELEGKSSIKTADYGTATVSIPANGVRTVDGAGLDVSAPIGVSSAKTYTVQAVTNSDVTISDADSNPDARTIIVDEDNTTDGNVVSKFEIESRDAEISLNNVRVYATSTVGTVYNLVSDLVLTLDGQTFSGTIASTTAMSTYYDFDINGDVTIAKDDTITGSISADINKNATGTLAVSLSGNTTSFDAEMVSTGDAVTSVGGEAVGKTVTLALVGVDVSVTKKTLAVTSVDGVTNDYTTAVFDVKITNNSNDTLYVPLTATTAVAGAATKGIYLAPSSTVGASTIVVDQVTSNTETSNTVKVQKGQTATIEVTVTYLPGVAMTNQMYQLSTVRFSKTVGLVNEIYTAPDTSSYKTGTVTIVN